MGVLMGTLVKVAINIAAGIGVANIFDNWIKPRVPAQYYPEKVGTGLNVWKILWLSFAFIAGYMILNFLGKTLGIQVLRRKI